VTVVSTFTVMTLIISNKASNYSEIYFTPIEITESYRLKRRHLLIEFGRFLFGETEPCDI
jgi:hypothetical protein